MNCLCKWLLACAPRTIVNSFPSPEKFLFCTEKVESIEWQDLVPRLRIGDCYKIFILHWELCDPPWSIFLLEVANMLSTNCFLNLRNVSNSSELNSFLLIMSLMLLLLENLTAWFDPKFPDSRRTGFLGQESWDTQPNYVDSSNKAADLFAPSFFDFLLGFSSASTCLKKHVLPLVHPVSETCSLNTGGCPNVHDGLLQFL